MIYLDLFTLLKSQTHEQQTEQNNYTHAQPMNLLAHYVT